MLTVDTLHLISIFGLVMVGTTLRLDCLDWLMEFYRKQGKAGGLSVLVLIFIMTDLYTARNAQMFYLLIWLGVPCQVGEIDNSRGWRIVWEGDAHYRCALVIVHPCTPVLCWWAYCNPPWCFWGIFLICRYTVSYYSPRPCLLQRRQLRTVFHTDSALQKTHATRWVLRRLERGRTYSKQLEINPWWMTVKPNPLYRNMPKYLNWISVDIYCRVTYNWASVSCTTWITGFESIFNLQYM